MPQLNAKKIAQRVEWCGYGPAHGSRGIVKVQWNDTIHSFRLTEMVKSGILKYDNDVDPELQAVATIISKLPGNTLFEDRVELGIDRKAILRCHYLWMDDYPNKQRYLMDIVIRGKQRWHSTGLVSYMDRQHDDFWVKAVEMLDEFAGSTKLNSLDENLVNFIKSKCVEAEFGR